MGRIRQPTSYFGGGFTVDGDLSLDGDITLSPVRIGEGAVGLDTTLVVGDYAEASGQDSTAVGNNAVASNNSTTAFGQEAEARGVDATALGRQALAPNNWNTVIGYQAGSVSNGANVVLVGRMSEGEGDDVVAIGENAIANADRATAVGKATIATGVNSSAFGQGSEATADSSTIFGQNAIADAADATALGQGAEARGVNSVAFGSGTIVERDNTYGFGDRDLRLPLDRSLIYPDDPGTQVLVDSNVTDASPQGEDQSYSMRVNGDEILRIEAEADGAGGIQNELVYIPKNLVVDGSTSEVDSILSGDIVLEDSPGSPEFKFDATTAPSTMYLYGNYVGGIGAQPSANTGAIRLGNNVAINARDSSDSQDLTLIDIDDADSMGLADSAISSIDAKTDLILEANLSSSGGAVIWDSSNGYVPTGVLQHDSVTLSVGGNLTSSGSVALGGSFSIGLDDPISLTTVNVDTISDNGSSAIDFNIGGARRANMDSSGNLSIEGELTEGAAL